MSQKILVLDENRKSVSHAGRMDSAREIAWVGHLRTRQPEEENRSFAYPGIFRAAGREYASLKELMVTKTSGETVALDKYGREVFFYAQRFPCFDSYDYLYEDRFYRWFFIREKGKLTRVYYADERDAVEVTEDVRWVENTVLEYLIHLGWIERE